jgi:hypothetical protein
MFRTLRITLVLAAFALAGADGMALADTSTSVRFRAGGDSATYAGRIRGDDTARFYIDARRGQVMQLSLAADNPQANFNVLPPGSREAIFIGSNEGSRFSGILPSTGRFVIEVYLMRAAARRNEAARFKLNIAIPAGGGAAPAGDFADGDAGGPDNWTVAGVAANDRLNVRSAPSANAEIVGRLRNGATVRNLGCRTIGSSRWCRISARGEGGVHGWTNGRFLVEGSGHSSNWVPERHDPADGEIRDTKCNDSPSDCIRKAEDKCGGEFRTIHSESHAGGLVNDMLPGPMTWYFLEYQCGYSDGRMPQFPFRGAHYEAEYDTEDDFTPHLNTSRAVNEAAMRDSCKSAAALAFGQRSKHVLVLPVERIDDGYAVFGQYPEDGPDVTTFTCKFNRAGVFKHVRPS